MTTKILSNLISKYSLNGLIESVNWEIAGGVTTVNMCSSDKSMYGKVIVNAVDIPDGKIGIYHTPTLDNILSILGNEITIENFQSKYLLISDKETKANFALAEPTVIDSVSPVPKLKGTPKFDLTLNITDKFYDQLSKAKKALPDVGHVVFNVASNEPNCEVVIGFSSNNTTKITYSVPCEAADAIDNLAFNLNYIKEIMSCNSDILATGKIEISKSGLMKISFAKDAVTSEYYLIKINHS